MRRFRSSSTSFPISPGPICEVELELTVWDGNAERRVPVSAPDGPFVVMSIELEEDEGEYGTVYLGGEICRRYVIATPDGASCHPAARATSPSGERAVRATGTRARLRHPGLDTPLRGYSTSAGLGVWKDRAVGSVRWPA